MIFMLILVLFGVLGEEMFENCMLKFHFILWVMWCVKLMVERIECSSVGREIVHGFVFLFGF